MYEAFFAANKAFLVDLRGTADKAKLALLPQVGQVLVPPVNIDKGCYGGPLIVAGARSLEH